MIAPWLAEAERQADFHAASWLAEDASGRWWLVYPAVDGKRQAPRASEFVRLQWEWTTGELGRCPGVGAA